MRLFRRIANEKVGKKEIMEHLDSFITGAFECDHISVTFPNDNMVRIELTNDSESLVRCKDCKKYEADKYNPGFGDCFGSCDSLPGVEENFFCADGERKEGDGE